MRTRAGLNSTGEYDYIIVGAGSAGCTLAYRLGQNSSVSILVLEAGGWDYDPFIHIPLGMGYMHQKRSHDWGYDIEAETGTAGREIEAMRGKVLGGSSAINHMSHVRGNRNDYERWASSGLRSWAYGEVLPYFRRSETWIEGASMYRGGEGPLSVVRASSQDPLLDAFIEAGKECGLPYNDDYNAAKQDGMGRGQFTIRDGRRHTAADAFLRPALKRGNVHLISSAHATRVLLRSGRAEGVEFLLGGERDQARATREVILSAGTFNTPQLLMLSGIGPENHLRNNGIVPIVNAPEVGRNLQDHMSVMVSAARPVAGPFRKELRFDRMAISMCRAYAFGTGPATRLPGGLHGYVRLNTASDVPDIQLMFRAVNAHPHLWFPGIRKPDEDQCGVRVNLLHPKSRGHVALRSGNPLDNVRIFGGFLKAGEDMSTLCKGVRFAREIMAQKVLGQYRGTEINPGSGLKLENELEPWIRRTAVTVHHPVGTCAMGMDENSVVDPELRVRKVEGLRIIDASVVPDLVSGNINACVMMIAEKAADIIQDYRGQI